MRINKESAMKVAAVLGIGSLCSVAYAGHYVEIPEPSAFSLLGLGTAVLIVASLRRKRNHKQ